MNKSTNHKKYLNTDLTSKIVVFTDGTDGMGKAAVEKLAKIGAKIMLLDRSSYQKLAREILVRK